MTQHPVPGSHRIRFACDLDRAMSDDLTALAARCGVHKTTLVRALIRQAVEADASFVESTLAAALPPAVSLSDSAAANRVDGFLDAGPSLSFWLTQWSWPDATGLTLHWIDNDDS